jgi:hypothetical protein
MGSLDRVETLWRVQSLEKRLMLGAKRWLVTLEFGFQPGFCFQRWLPFCGSIPARKIVISGLVLVSGDGLLFRGFSLLGGDGLGELEEIFWVVGGFYCS